MSRAAPVADSYLVARAQRHAGANVHDVASKILVYQAGCELLQSKMPLRERSMLERGVRNAERWLRTFVHHAEIPRRD